MDYGGHDSIFESNVIIVRWVPRRRAKPNSLACPRARPTFCPTAHPPAHPPPSTRNSPPTAARRRPYDGQNCQNMWNFVEGHQDKILNNTCAIWQVGVGGNPKDADMVMTQNDNGSCDPSDPSHPIILGNHYFTTHGNASINCGGDWGTTIADMQKKRPDFEVGSTWTTLPDADTVVQWGRDVLGM